MKTVIIGGTGHVGTYLVPRLVRAGHNVTVITRGQSQPYHDFPEWGRVERVTIDREAADAAGNFGEQVAAMGPDIVVDMICFTKPSAEQIVTALRGKVQHFLMCGTIWIYGHSMEVPATEDQPCQPFGEYGIHKAEMTTYLLDEARRNNFPVTLLHPGHIMGPGWEILTPVGNRNQSVLRQFARGEEVVLPNLGMETLHHVHGDDVAQIFELAINNRSVALGEGFHAVASNAVTMRGYAEAVFRWFGHEPNISFLPWEQWRETVSAADAEETWDHIAHSPNASIEKARRLLNYQPRFTSLGSIYEALQWIVDHKAVAL